MWQSNHQSKHLRGAKQAADCLHTPQKDVLFYFTWYTSKTEAPLKHYMILSWSKAHSTDSRLQRERSEMLAEARCTRQAGGLGFIRV